MGPLSCICNIVLDHSFQCMMFRSALGYYSQSYIQQEIALNAQMWALHAVMEEMRRRHVVQDIS